ncbi:MAG: PLP-dependent aminotransferase family protein [Planctomycetota bacterium]
MPDTPPIPFSAKARRTTEQPISYLMAAAVENPDIISFAAGLVDPRTLPVMPVRKIVDDLLGNDERGRVVMQYGTTHGFAELRQLLHQHLCDIDGVDYTAQGVTPDHLVTATGSQQAIYMLADVLADPGDIGICCQPDYFVYTGTLQSIGVEVVGVPMDEGGMCVEALERSFEELKHQNRLQLVRFVYVQTYHQNPTGLTLAADRRPAILELVKKYSALAGHRIIIIEDAAYRELTYEGPEDQPWAPPTIKSLDVGNEYVALSQTFSKPFAPGIKLGYAALPGAVLDAVLQQKGNHDFGSANLAQHIAAEALRTDVYADQLKALHDGYRAKMHAMLDALKRHMPDGVTWTHPRGGLYVWATLPESIDTARESALFADCVKRGVMYVPGDYCYTGANTPRNQMRLSFGVVPIDKIELGIERLAAAVGAN